MSIQPSSGDFPGLPRRYQIERLLNEGSQKRVYLAHDSRVGRPVAVAVVDAQALRPASIERLHEARAMARVGDHPHIVAIYDVIERPDSLYIVSRYLSGGDLEARIAEREHRALPVAEAVRIGSEICQALEHAHASGISHCDVKPGNILLDENDAALLGDFGLAQIAETPVAGEGHVLGTPAYLAPEQISRNERGPSCDLYALGCVLYELTTGRPPFVAASATDVLRLHQVARPTPPADRNRLVPAALNDLILKLLEKQPAARPASARDVAAALGGIRDLGAAQASAARESDLVGREDEMKRLELALDRARDGRPSLMLVAGEAGIGKSRLLRELRQIAEDRGCLVLFGQGYRDAPFPFRPFVEALTPLAGRLSELDPERAELIREFLYLRGGAPASREIVPHRETHDRRLFVTICDAVASFSTPRPLVVILDDLHWSDSASLDLLEHLAFALAQRAPRADLELVVIAGYRPAPADSRLAQAVEQVAHHGVAQCIELSPLDESGVFEVMTSLGIEQPSGQLVHAVREVTGGNPLFLREVIDHLVRSGKLAQQRGFAVSARPSEDLELPSSLASAIADRTRLLGADCRELVTLASLLGVRFDLDRLAAISGNRGDALSETLHEAVSLGVLVDEGHKYRFTHPLVQQVMSQGLSQTRRQRLHLRIAQHLHERYGADSPTADLEIAFHLIRADSLADPAQLMRHANRAAQHALARYAWNEAAELLEAAIAAGEASPDSSPLEVAELHRKAGIAYFRRYDSGPCVHHFDSAAQIFSSQGDGAGLARTLNDRTGAAIRLGLIPYGDPTPEVKALENAIEQLGPNERGLRALISTTLAEAYWAARQPAAAERTCIEALDLASELGDHRLCAEASVNLGLIYLQTLRVEDALSTWREGRAHAKRAEDLHAEEQCVQRVALALFTSARLDEAERTALEVQELNRILQVPGEASLTSSLLMAIAIRRGDLAMAERHGQDALDQLRRVKYAWAAIMTVPALAYVRALRGDLAGARAVIGLLAESGIAFADPRFFEPRARDLRRLVDCIQGQTDRMDVSDLVSRPESGGDLDLAQLVDVCARVEFADALQTPELATGTKRLLEVAEESGILFTTGWPSFIPRLRGVVALLEHGWDEAVTHLERATAIAELAAAPPERARASFDLAQALAARNSDRDRERARAILNSVVPELRAYCPGVALLRAEKLSVFLCAEVS